MNLKELIQKLKDKPCQDLEVEFLVYAAEDRSILCADLSGPSLSELVSVLAKNGKGRGSAINESLRPAEPSNAQLLDGVKKSTAYWEERLLLMREDRKHIDRENTALREKMTEAWKLVHVMHGQDYWERADQWLDENKEFKPEGFVG